MTPFRTEQDALGTRQIPADALYGIHTQRAVENFPIAMRPVHPGLIHAFGVVKQACLQTVHETGGWNKAETFAAVIDACKEMRAGKLDAHIQVDALQGGAGTSTNMNVNEVLANRALQRLGYNPGQYDILHPLEDINRWQSTNDTFPTALRVAAIDAIKDLEKAVILLQEAFEERETAFSGIVKVGRTEMQDAVLTTMGRTMSAFAEAFSRDRWRIYKCEERLRVINLGGTAIGTGLGAPREYIFRVTDVLRSLTGFGLARAENLVEATQNADVFVEVSGILKACAANLLKTAGDLRLMSSGPDAGFCELILPPLQAGSSIMPGKINPVMPEAVSQAALRVMANDQALTSAAALGNLELNAFMPLIADCLLDSLSLLNHACRLLAERCIQGLEANAAQCARHVNTSVATATALVAPLGYRTAEAVLTESRATGLPIGDILEKHDLMNQEAFASLITPESVTSLGSTGSTPSANHSSTPLPNGLIKENSMSCNGKSYPDATLSSEGTEPLLAGRQSTPKGMRLHIGIFGRRNVGKSSLLNAITLQETSIVSETAGTTTDPVEKPMELLPIGPVVFIDTAGLDDIGDLGFKRIGKTRQAISRADLAFIVTDAGQWGSFEKELADDFMARQIPVVAVFNKSDKTRPGADLIADLEKQQIAHIEVSAIHPEECRRLLRDTLIASLPEDFIQTTSIVGDLVNPGDVVMLVVPIDLEAPKGRLILPQVQTIRDLLDHDACCMVVKERELREAFSRLRSEPALVITDSQAFLKVASDTPDSVRLTSFSILFARLKGDLNTFVRGAKTIDRLRAGDRILVAEACTHHQIGDDIGRVKIPRWLSQYVGGKLQVDHCQGNDFPEDVTPYQLIIHCGSCTFNRRNLLSRLAKCTDAGVPVTNYGIAIAKSLGIIERALSPFPGVLEVYQT